LVLLAAGAEQPMDDMDDMDSMDWRKTSPACLRRGNMHFALVHIVHIVHFLKKNNIKSG
jgi:hypothetical protein